MKHDFAEFLFLLIINHNNRFHGVLGFWGFGSLEFHLFKLLADNGTKVFKNGENEFFCSCGSGIFLTLAARCSLLLASLVCSVVRVLIYCYYHLSFLQIQFVSC